MRKIKIDRDLVDAIVGVHCFFNDVDKVALWFRLDNPSFGGVSPEFLVNCGRAKKVATFVNEYLDDGKRLVSPRQTKALRP